MGRGTGGKQNSQRKTGKPIWAYFAPGLLVAAAFFVVMALISLVVTHQVRDQQRQQAAQLVAETLVARVQGLLHAHAALTELATTNLAVHRALGSGDQSALAQAAALSAEALPGVRGVRLFPKLRRQEIAPDPSGNAPMGYAGVDMVVRALEGKPPLGEIHQISSGSPYLAMAAPVRQADEVVGAMLVAWPLESLKALLEQMPAFDGRVELSQGGKEGYLFAGAGEASAAVVAAGWLDVPGSRWQVSYGVRPLEYDSDALWLFGIALAGGVLMLLVLLLQMRMLARDTREDMVSVLNLGEGIAKGNVGREPKVRMRAHQDAILLLYDAACSSLKKRRERTQSMLQEDSTMPNSVLLPGMAGQQIAVEQSEPAQPAPANEASPPAVSAEIFRAYDVRGVVGKTLDAGVAKVIGQAFAQEARKQQVLQTGVAYDARLSSPELYQAFCQGLASQGMDVVQLGQGPVALPYLYMHTTEGSAAVMVTGSHNPPDYNGFKLYINAKPVAGEALQALYQAIQEQNFHHTDAARGKLQACDISADYLRAVSEQVQVARPLKVVVDGGNGVAGELACDLIEAVGCEPVGLFCEPDGHFPNHHPDPNDQATLEALRVAVQGQKADLGIAFDGDGDRLAIIDNHGEVVRPEHLLMLLAADVLQRHPGTDVVFDVKSSRNLASFVLSRGGRPIMASSGHTRMKDKMRETGALLGGEFSGHYFIKERWFGSDDALYAAVRILELLSLEPRPLDQLLAELPHSHATPELFLPLQEGEADALMQRILAQADFPDAQVVSTDGLRVEFSQAWGLVRASNTTPALSFRFEGETEAAMQQAQKAIRDLITQVVPSAQLPF